MGEVMTAAEWNGPYGDVTVTPNEAARGRRSAAASAVSRWLSADRPVALSGAWRSAKAVASHMIERGEGSIVMVASVNGLEPGEKYAHYTGVNNHHQ
jgi:short-subunit dehydrogenase